MLTPKYSLSSGWENLSLSREDLEGGGGLRGGFGGKRLGRKGDFKRELGGGLGGGIKQILQTK